MIGKFKKERKDRRIGNREVEVREKDRKSRRIEKIDEELEER